MKMFSMHFYVYAHILYVPLCVLIRQRNTAFIKNILVIPIFMSPL